MTKTYTTADVCELADNITQKLCELLLIEIDMETDEEENETEAYSPKAQAIFDICFNSIEEEYEAMGLTNERDL